MIFERLSLANQTQFNEYLELYHALFPEWELEPDERVISRHCSGEYFTYLTYDNVGLLGFYTMSIVPEYGYSLLNFMGIRRDLQGLGFGQILLEHVKTTYTQGLDHIDYLFVEAEDRPMRFYLRNEFRLIDSYYRIPSFTDHHSLIDMNLLIHTKIDDLDQITADQVHPIIRHILIFGYDLDSNDPRIPKCFAWQYKNFQILTS